MATDFRHRRVDDIAVVRLTHKYADVIDDVDLRAYRVGETLALPAYQATLLVAEGWAERVAERRSAHHAAEPSTAGDAADSHARRQRRRMRDRLR
jgi:hypothetical protein